MQQNNVFVLLYIKRLYKIINHCNCNFVLNVKLKNVQSLKPRIRVEIAVDDLQLYTMSFVQMDYNSVASASYVVARCNEIKRYYCYFQKPFYFFIIVYQLSLRSSTPRIERMVINYYATLGVLGLLYTHTP